MTGHLGRSTILLAALLAGTAASRAGAQSPPAPSAAALEQARAQFGEAVGLAEEGRWEEAVSLFRQVLTVRRAPPVVYNLAHALFELGEFAEADALLGEVLEDPTTPASLRTSSSQLRAQMERTGGRLTVSASGALEGVTLLLDHQPLDPAWIGRPLLVREGRHVATAERDGVLVARAEATVAVGGTASVSLAVASAPDAAAAAASATPTTSAEAEAQAVEAAATDEGDAAPAGRRWKLGVGIGAAVVAVALAVGLGVGLSGGGGDSDPFSGNLDPPVLVIP